MADTIQPWVPPNAQNTPAQEAAARAAIANANPGNTTTAGAAARSADKASSTPSSSLAVNPSNTGAKPSPQSATGAGTTGQGGNQMGPVPSTPATPTTPTTTPPATQQTTPPASQPPGQPQYSPQVQAEITRSQQVYAQADQLAGTGKYVGQTPDQVRAGAHAYADSLRAGGPVGPDAVAPPPTTPVVNTQETADATNADGTFNADAFKNPDGTYDIQGMLGAFQSSQALALQKIQGTSTAEAEQNYKDSMAQLNGAENQLEIINQQRQALINASDAEQKADADKAYTANKAAVDLQKQKTDKAYNDMIINQKLANKRATVAKETAMGVLGGGFTTAGVADIQDVIMQGEYKVLSLQQDQDIQDQGLTDQLVNITNDYKTDNLKIEQFKTDSMNKAYSDLQSAIASIQADKLTTAEQKQKAIDDAANNYNTGVMNLNTDALNARVTLSNAAQARLDALKAQSLQQTSQDTTDARNTLNTMLSTLTGASLDAMSDAQKQYLVGLGKKAGIDVGFILDNMSATARQSAIDAAKSAAKKGGSGGGSGGTSSSGTGGGNDQQILTEAEQRAVGEANTSDPAYASGLAKLQAGGRAAGAPGETTGNQNYMQLDTKSKAIWDRIVQAKKPLTSAELKAYGMTTKQQAAIISNMGGPEAITALKSNSGSSNLDSLPS